VPPQRGPAADPFGLVGTLLDGQYRVDAVVGEGGFGVVYRGFHLSLEQPVAIKALKVLAPDDRKVQDALFDKFKDEAKLLYTLSQSSLNIVRSMDFGAVTAPSGMWAPFMVLEWLEGRSLAEDLVQRRQAGQRGRSLDEALALFEPIVRGIAVAHQQRVAHRDVKPANVFLSAGPEGTRVKILDFGIAKIIRDGEGQGTRSPFASFTWLYAAPEQLDPRVGPTGLATDVYALALLFTQLLTDRVPVEGRDVISLMKAATDPTVRPTPRARGAVVPDDVELVLRRALAVDPRARFANASELWGALQAARRSSVPSLPTAPPAVTAPYGPPPAPASSLAPYGHTGTGVMPPARTGPAQAAPTGPVAAAPGRPMDPITAAALSPPRMTPPPGTGFYPQVQPRPPPPTSPWPLALIIVAVVVCATFLTTCSLMYAACR